MTFEQFYRILRARRKLALSLFFGILSIAVGLSFLLPKTYTAKTTVMVELKPDPISGMAQMTAQQPAGYLATQVNIVKSDVVARRVVEMMRMADNPEMRSKWAKETKERGSYQDWLGKALLKGLTVSLARESSIIEIEYESIEPAFAAALANAFAKAYMDTVVQMRTDPAKRYTDYFDERAQLARQKLERAQTKLADAQREKGILLNDERIDNEVTRLNELGQQLVGIRAMLAESENRKLAANRQADQTQEVMNSPVVGSLKADLAKQYSNLNEVSSQKGDQHPLVIQLKASIAESERRLSSEVRKVSGTVTTSDTIVRAREAAASKAYDEQRNKLMKMKEQRSDVALLEREVESAQRVYEAIQLRQSQSSLESNSSQSAMAILTPAVEPPTHSSPRLLINLLIGVFGGSVATLLATMGAELLDRRVRTSFDIVNALELPVIGVLPSPNESRFRLFRRNDYGQLLPSPSSQQS